MNTSEWRAALAESFEVYDTVERETLARRRRTWFLLAFTLAVLALWAFGMRAEPRWMRGVMIALMVIASGFSVGSLRLLTSTLRIIRGQRRAMEERIRRMADE